MKELHWNKLSNMLNKLLLCNVNIKFCTIVFLKLISFNAKYFMLNKTDDITDDLFKIFWMISSCIRRRWSNKICFDSGQTIIGSSFSLKFCCKNEVQEVLEDHLAKRSKFTNQWIMRSVYKKELNFYMASYISVHQNCK